MSNRSLAGIDKRELQYFEGLEIGAVSVKWVRRTIDGVVASEVVRHEGYPKKKILEIFKRYKTFLPKSSPKLNSVRIEFLPQHFFTKQFKEGHLVIFISHTSNLL